MNDEAGSAEMALAPKVWIEESRQFAVASVYTDEVLSQVALVSRGLAIEVPKITLSEAYLKKAG